ncbi:hypothetical protein J1614_005169 [Plenodomus biglobosus]|nr:hypothetical protein J1614_005169 [Plenodomus biglobosus]
MASLLWYVWWHAPYLVLVVGVQIQAALLRALPVLGYALVDVCLVDDLGDQLGLLADGARIGRRQLAAEDGIFTARGDQQAQQSPDTVDCEAQHQDGDDDEDGDASPHGDCRFLCCAAVLSVV